MTTYEVIRFNNLKTYGFEYSECEGTQYYELEYPIVSHCRIVASIAKRPNEPAYLKFLFEGEFIITKEELEFLTNLINRLLRDGVIKEVNLLPHQVRCLEAPFWEG